MKTNIWQTVLVVIFALALLITTVALVLKPSASLAIAPLIFTGALIIAASLPSVSNFKLTMKGVEAKMNSLQGDVDHAKERIAAQQKAINTLVSYTMSASIFRHLCGIVLLKTYNLDFQKDADRRELYFLRDHGYIQPRHGGFIYFDDGGVHNVAEMAVATPIGIEYVVLRKLDIPPEMRGDHTNLRADAPIGRLGWS